MLLVTILLLLGALSAALTVEWVVPAMTEMLEMAPVFVQQGSLETLAVIVSLATMAPTARFVILAVVDWEALVMRAAQALETVFATQGSTGLSVMSVKPADTVQVALSASGTVAGVESAMMVCLVMARAFAAATSAVMTVKSARLDSLV